MIDTPRDILQATLIAHRMQIEELGELAGIDARQAQAALMGRPICAVSYLRLCAAIALNPIPELPCATPAPADFDFVQLAMGFRIRRGLKRQSGRAAAKTAGISASTVCRIENGDVMNIGVVLRACRYIGMNPYGYFKLNHRSVPRETCTETREATAFA